MSFKKIQKFKTTTYQSVYSNKVNNKLKVDIGNNRYTISLLIHKIIFSFNVQVTDSKGLWHCLDKIKLQHANFPLSKHVIRFHELPAEAMQSFIFIIS